MLQLRVVAPTHRTDEVLAVVRSLPGTFNVTLFPGAAVDPAGDVLLCDVAREGANDLIVALRELGVHQDGTVALTHVDVLLSEAGTAAEARAPGQASDAAVWAEVDARSRDESALTASFLAFIVIAALIAAVGLVEDAPILIVGAMVVGPEFGPIAGLSVGLFNRQLNHVLSALRTLVVGLAAAALAAFAATAAAAALDLVPREFAPHVQPLTGFIVDPSVLSFVVALLAGIAGTLSLTQAKSGALIGVLISVTTIPAVAALGVAGALGHWDDARGAAIQLALNLTALVIAAVATLWTQREAWKHISR